MDNEITYRSTLGERRMGQLPWEALAGAEAAISAAGLEPDTWREAAHGWPTHVGFTVGLDEVPSPPPGTVFLGGKLYYPHHTPSSPPTSETGEIWRPGPATATPLTGATT